MESSRSPKARKQAAINLDDLSFDQKEMLCSLDFSQAGDIPLKAALNTLAYQRKVCIELAQKLEDGADDVASDQWEALRYRAKANPDFQPELSPKTQKIYKAISWLTSFRIFVSNLNRIRSQSSKPFLPPEFGYVGTVTNGVELVVDSTIVATSLAVPGGKNEEKLPLFTRFKNLLNKGQRPGRMSGALISFVLNVASIAYQATIGPIIGFASLVYSLAFEIGSTFYEYYQIGKLIKIIDQKIKISDKNIRIKNALEQVATELKETKSHLSTHREFDLEKCRRLTNEHNQLVQQLQDEDPVTQQQSLLFIKKRLLEKQAQVKWDHAAAIFFTSVVTVGIGLIVFLINPPMGVWLAFFGGSIAAGFVKKVAMLIYDSEPVKKIREKVWNSALVVAVRDVCLTIRDWFYGLYSTKKRSTKHVGFKDPLTEEIKLNQEKLEEKPSMFREVKRQGSTAQMLSGMSLEENVPLVQKNENQRETTLELLPVRDFPVDRKQIHEKLVFDEYASIIDQGSTDRTAYRKMLEAELASKPSDQKISETELASSQSVAKDAPKPPVFPDPVHLSWNGKEVRDDSEPLFSAAFRSRRY